MQLTVRSVAELLNVSEKSIYRWISEGGLPAYRMSGQYRFNRAELLEWATRNRVNVPLQVLSEPVKDSDPLPDLVEALQAGGIFYRIGGKDKESVLRSTVEVLRLPDEVDRDFLLQVLLAREALESTGIGDGVAVPHTRNPIVLHVPKPMVTLCFLENPIEFGALDGKPVHVLFTVISPTVRAHLHLLSRLVFALRDAEFKSWIEREGSREVILEVLRRVSQGLRKAAGGEA